MQELERIEKEIKETLAKLAQNPNPELLAKANELRRQYVDIDVRINGGK